MEKIKVYTDEEIADMLLKEEEKANKAKLRKKLLESFRKHEKDYEKALKKNEKVAEEYLRDEDKMEKFLQQLEDKLKLIPKYGEQLSSVPIMVSLVRNYVRKEYTDIPWASMVVVVAALAYFVSPVDIIPDPIPVIGYFDDAAVINLALKFIYSDLDDYVLWREQQGLVYE